MVTQSTQFVHSYMLFQRNQRTIKTWRLINSFTYTQWVKEECLCQINDKLFHTKTESSTETASFTRYACKLGSFFGCLFYF